MTKHVVVWIDHKEAHIFHVRRDGHDEAIVMAPHGLHHKHPKGPEGVKEHPNDLKQFFAEVERSLADADEILLVGPSSAKLELLRHLGKHAHALEAKVVGVESVDHPTDGQLVAYARKEFELDAATAR
ncbi:MAG: translational machinery protein [Polyangiales bacterium]